MNNLDKSHYLKDYGFCGTISPDGERVCILEIGHSEAHPWDEAEPLYVELPTPDDSEWCKAYWALRNEFVAASTANQKKINELVEQVEILQQDQPGVSSIGSPGLEVLTWRGKSYVESHRSFLT